MSMSRHNMRVIHFLKSPIKYLRVVGQYFRTFKDTISLSTYGELKLLSGNEITYYFDSVKTDSRLNFRERWTRATSVAKSGRYLTAVASRKEILSDARKLIGADAAYTPHILESDFLSHYGHLALLQYVKAASESFLIPGRGFNLMANHQDLVDRPFLRSATKGLQVSISFGGGSILDHNALFGISDKTLLVSSHDDLMDMQVLINTVEENKQNDAAVELFYGALEYELVEFEYLTSVFKKKGFDWFATLHVRKTNGKAAARDNSFEKFFPLVEYIRSKGGFVIIIGDHVPNESELAHDSILDFRPISRGKPHLVDIAIGKAKYFIGPDSGPSAHAIYLGIPTLRADGVALMKNTYSTHAPSISLPKFWTDRSGNRINWLEVAQGELGFCEDESFIEGFQLNFNSSDHILDAFKELEFVSTSKSGHGISVDNKLLLELKSENGGIGSGTLASCFFDH